METIDIIQENNYQLIKIPIDFKINDNKVYIKKMGDTLQIIPYHNLWDNFYKNLSNFSDDYMNERSDFVENNRENIE